MLTGCPVNRSSPDCIERVLALVGTADSRYIVILEIFALDKVLRGFSSLGLSEGKQEYG